MSLTEISKEIIETEKKSLILKISKQLESINLEIELLNGNISHLVEKDKIIQNYILNLQKNEIKPQQQLGEQQGQDITKS